jgi:large subunit ribosomal protein L17
MRRNMAQNLIEHGEIRTTLPKAKETRRFVEKLITIARKGTIDSRRRVEAMLRDRAILDSEHRDTYEQMTDAQRKKVMVARSGRRHRTGAVPAGYNKKKIPFVATSVMHKLMNEVAPSYKDRPGGYTRIIRLSKRRIGDNSELAILQLVGLDDAVAKSGGKKKSAGRRRARVLARIAYLEGKKPRRHGSSADKSAKSTKAAADRPVSAESAGESES